MPWRRKPSRFLRYWSRPVDPDGTRASGKQFKTVLVYCVNCHHNSRLEIASLLDWDWYDISMHRLGQGQMGRRPARLKRGSSTSTRGFADRLSCRDAKPAIATFVQMCTEQAQGLVSRSACSLLKFGLCVSASTNLFLARTKS
jgi:hypothetical protein